MLPDRSDALQILALHIHYKIIACKSEVKTNLRIKFSSLYLFCLHDPSLQSKKNKELGKSRHRCSVHPRFTA